MGTGRDSLPNVMETVSIRRAIEADAPAIALLSAILGYDSDEVAIAGRLHVIRESDSDLLIVAVDSRRAVIGWLQAHAAHIIESGLRIEITGLVVSPDQRRRGVGRALAAEAERWARTQPAETVVVRSNVQRLESHAFYRALGYAPTKTQNVYRKNLIKS